MKVGLIFFLIPQATRYVLCYPARLIQPFWADFFARGSRISEGASGISKKQKNSRRLFTTIFKPKILVSRSDILVCLF